MKLDQNTTLADFWLHKATSALCDQARARIAAEVRAHYADLVEAHVAEGMQLVDARLKALEDLGDAKAAACRFRKQHLTKSEEKHVSGLIGLSGSKFFLLSKYLLFACLSFIFLNDDRIKANIIISVACFIAFVLFSTVAWVQARRVEAKLNVVRALLLDLAEKIGFGIFFIIVAWAVQSSFRFLLLMLSLHSFLTAFISYRLWKKFRREQKRRGGALEVA